MVESTPPPGSTTLETAPRRLPPVSSAGFNSNWQLAAAPLSDGDPGGRHRKDPQRILRRPLRASLQRGGAAAVQVDNPGA